MKNINTSLGSNDLVYQITYLIRHSNDYENASKLMLDNSLSIEELSKRTMKLSIFEFAVLGDTLIKNKK